MSSKVTAEFDAFFKQNDEAKFDNRLADKKIQHGFITRAERDGFVKGLPEEKEYEFTSAEALDAES